MIMMEIISLLFSLFYVAVIVVVIVLIITWLHGTYLNTAALQRRTIAAPGWFAHCKDNDKEYYLPLVCWVLAEERSEKNKLEHARGMVFIGDTKGGEIGYCDLITGFVGYVYRPNKM